MAKGTSALQSPVEQSLPSPPKKPISFHVHCCSPASDWLLLVSLLVCCWLVLRCLWKVLLPDMRLVEIPPTQLLHSGEPLVSTTVTATILTLQSLLF
uniref:Uncharacterized protein n=1 Tax=Physcomitrium patens TaxID=3218 RepID=A0A2K1JKB6_PHYPA|nr:hypothetical protein PHYPA_016851 [Physcomitrium patens]